jgi:carbonic anhydrase
MWGKKHKKVAVMLTCADWRLHQRKVDLNARMATILGVNGVDLICVPGPNGLIKPERASEWQAVVAQIKLLIGVHAPHAVVVLAHQRCAGHPVADGVHDSDAAATARALKAETGFPGPVRAAVAVYRSECTWDLKPLAHF